MTSQVEKEENDVKEESDDEGAEIVIEEEEDEDREVEEEDEDGELEEEVVVDLNLLSIKLMESGMDMITKILSFISMDQLVIIL